MDPSTDTRLFLDALRAAYVWTFTRLAPAPSTTPLSVGPVRETPPLLAALDTAAAAPVLLYPAVPDAAVAFREQRRAATLPRLWSNSFLTAF